MLFSVSEDTGDATESVEGEQVTSEVAGTSRSKAPSLDEVNPSPQPCKKSRTYSSRVVGQSSNLLPIEVEQLQENKGGATKSLKVERITSKVAGTSISKPPSFTIVMKDSYVYGYSLVIPTNFVKEYLKEKPKDFLLQVLEGRWTVSYRNGRFCTGWNKFASDNHLNVGDVCVFELIIKSRSYCFKVTIIRLSEETCSPAMREARKFTSENPFFTVNIRADDANDFRPRVPVFFMRKYLKDKHAVTLSFGNKLWPVNLIGTVRSKLSKGWSHFANESKVGARDVCIFELINKADAVFHVRIYRNHS
ncbi:hypothetical protein Fmac_023302 [Flemingia macrophylla]|uniref:TF-B3 domain-containing protein n=1 Tax=Flemingia macrophylla TaxID=520843 RepID=A0ABD1LL40_9FABA